MRFSLWALIGLALIGCGGGSTVSTRVAKQNGDSPTLQFVASPTSISAGGFVIGWQTSHATAVSFTPPLTGDDGDLPVKGIMVVVPQTTTTYTETATGPGGKTTQSITINVGPPQPTISIVANPTTLVTGSSQNTSSLTWTTQNATSASIDGVGTIPLPSDSISVSPSKTTTYIAHVTGPGGTNSVGVTVMVSAIALMANPGAIAPKQIAALTWNSPTASSITIDHGIGSVTGQSGSVAVSPKSTTRYTATVVDKSGNTSTGSALLVVSKAGSGFLQIKHIIFFVQENRSFDSYFGAMGVYRSQLRIQRPI